MRAWEKIVEFDSRGDPHTCFGIGERPACRTHGTAQAESLI